MLHVKRRSLQVCRGVVLVAASAVLASFPSRAQATSQSAPIGVESADTSSGGEAIASATRAYHASGVARTVVQGNFVTFPFGHVQPTLTCAVLRACVIELQSGEIVLSRIAGDTERWEFTSAPAGSDGRTVLVVVKPRECDITTNVVLATDRRLYDLTLDAPPCKPRSTNPQQPYVRHVRFYYPDETVSAWSKPSASDSARVRPDLAALNFHYAIRKDKHFPWTPAHVYDDGIRVFIKIPDQARHGEAPVLFLLERDGSKSLLNYALLDADTYVTDRLFDRAALVASIEGKERQLVIERTEGGR